MSSGAFHKIQKPLLLSIFVLGCFVTAFLMYYKPSTSWFNDLVKFSDSANPNHVVDTKKNDTNFTIVLVWLLPFGSTQKMDICSSVFNIESCFITADRRFYNQSDGVVFHHRDIHGDLSNMPKLQRPPLQRWIWMNMESPSNSRKLPKINNLFNLTMSYRQDSDIPVPSGLLMETETLEDFVPPSKNKLVCWIVSNWNPNYKRVKYYQELQKHINIDAYGSAFGKYISNKDYNPTISSCKFYLSFENSAHKDYITEKLYNPLSLGTVPVALGTSRQNYENFVPGDAFIHVDDFKSPKELAEYLLLLDKNQELYLSYFKWRKHFVVKKPHFWVEHTCKACKYIRQHKEYRAINNLNEWYWG
ncbi:4-galactosyl-N-acetylglucosaminide 3-alpha-L-fucosyltransferase 9-like [Cyprinodon tularosa]|uniref:4-galactosyl-N-acetylglucosaminide 3-alpha-L-fucosyltransferase 9-like n=1 Tax=Cyprinodon tularosa TaxID=77115 RepID=UPI0018E1DCD7|nr:4-galactosyl-N-acetylglucosaminide 3-alpha-L-fucosyltransferase 9-like [Cyprinodon tularosa]XP_038128998.1 4-galactosyl-N-acetylglucosaminide 3-alpha-L-fucosyltransferase 9-like [Cyprinodon tularosa]XP_038129005.1 4-galactosyl-N-acetylglucosaminide 3-alpha-L-fucosyltransferase 9-like [Cyprinodon tularosa]